MFPAFILILATTEESGLKSSVSWQLDWTQFSQGLLHRTRKKARGRKTLGENRLRLRKIFKQGKGGFFFFFFPSSWISLRTGDFKDNLEWKKYGRVATNKGNEWESLKFFLKYYYTVCISLWAIWKAQINFVILRLFCGWMYSS